jgi:hypothetical protein
MTSADIQLAVDSLPVLTQHEFDSLDEDACHVSCPWLSIPSPRFLDAIMSFVGKSKQKTMYPFFFGVFKLSFLA